MNIFYLHEDEKTCAEMHVNKHVIKMILEYAQLMSTAHRILDGSLTIGTSKTGRKKKIWVLPDDRETVLYSATHINHPSAVWARANRQNYIWLYRMWFYLCKEYTHRYGKIHSVETRMVERLYLPPNNIGNSEFYEPTPAMPDSYKVENDSVSSYRNYYLGAKSHMFSWKNREVPDFVKADSIYNLSQKSSIVDPIVLL